MNTLTFNAQRPTFNVQPKQPDEMEKLKMKRFGTKLIIGALFSAVCGLVSVLYSPPAAAQGYPLGSDIIQSATTTNLSCTLSNASSATATITSNLPWNVNSSARTRLTVYPDLYLDGYIAYGTTADTNTYYLTGTTGLPLPHGSTPVVWVRPALWKGPLTITFASSLATNAPTTNVTVRIVNELGNYSP